MLWVVESPCKCRFCGTQMAFAVDQKGLWTRSGLTCYTQALHCLCRIWCEWVAPPGVVQWGSPGPDPEYHFGQIFSPRGVWDTSFYQWSLDPPGDLVDMQTSRSVPWVFHFSRLRKGPGSRIYKSHLRDFGITVITRFGPSDFPASSAIRGIHKPWTMETQSSARASLTSCKLAIFVALRYSD